MLNIGWCDMGRRNCDLPFYQKRRDFILFLSRQSVPASELCILFGISRSRVDQIRHQALRQERRKFEYPSLRIICNCCFKLKELNNVLSNKGGVDGTYKSNPR
jgi:hypothetical protein